MAVLYWVGSGGNWSNPANWSSSSGGSGGAGVPTSADDAYFDNNAGLSGTVTLTADANCKSFQALGPYLNLDCQGSFAVNVAGDLRPYRLTVLNPPAGYVFNITANSTISSYGYDVVGLLVSAGVLVLATDFVCSGTLQVQGSASFDTAGYNLTLGAFKTGGFGPVVTLNASTIEITSAGLAWDFASGTLSAGTSTIKFTNASAAARTFNGGSKTYYNVWFAGAYSGTLDVNGSNVFNEFKSDPGAHTIRIAAGSTQTVNTFTLGGTGAAAKTTLKSQSDGTPWNVSKASGSVSCDWLDLRDSHASGGASFTATNSTDSGGNTGWTITTPPFIPTGDRRVRMTHMRR